MTSLVGQVLAYRYRLEASLGRGGSAQTYRACDQLDGSEVALKLLHPALPTEVLRLEFERVRELGHPHLMRVHDLAFAKVAGKPRAFYTAELVAGGDLRAHVQRVGSARARAAFADVLDALHTLHRLGLRHGDVKPENVLVDGHGRAVLIDLGCAAPLGTVAHTLSGTRGYLAPELLRAEAADERADLYAYGCVLRELTGESELARRLTAQDARDRPSSAREVLALLDGTRDVEASTQGRASRCFGRDALLTRAEQALRAALAAEEGPRVVWLRGAPGTGRSRCLRELAFTLASPHVDWLDLNARAALPLHDALERWGQSTALGFEALAEQLNELASGRDAAVLVLDDAEQLAAEAQLELRFAIHALPQRGRLAMLIASGERPPTQQGLLELELLPLDQSALASWSEGILTLARVPDLLRFTGGYPRYVERTLAALHAGRMREPELVDGSLDADQALLLADLSAREQRALAQIALLHRADEAALPRLFARDLITRRGGRLSLLREADRAPVLAALDARVLRETFLLAARTLAQRTAPRDLARAFEYFVRAGESALAGELLNRSRDAALRAPREFSQHLLAVSESLSPPQRVLLARLLRLAGEARRALQQLARVRRWLQSTELYTEAAEIYLALGKLARSERCMVRIADSELPAHAELRCRLLIRRGEYQRASELALRALRREDVGDSRARLLEGLALALAYLGDSAACEHADAALALHPAEEPRARARGHSLRGFVALRLGRAADAALAYHEAFELAEAHGLADLTLNALSNLGNARQALGQWGGALDAYERALRVATALERAASVRSLRANLANLALEIGDFARAQRALHALTEDAAKHGPAALERSLALYRAELAFLQGAYERVPVSLASLLEDAPLRERVEAHALSLSAALASGAGVQQALERLTRARGDEVLPPDLLARVAEVEGQALARTQKARAGSERLERALDALRGSDDQALLARLEGVLAELYREQHAHALASELSARARLRWERVALDLPKSLRDAFWAHPRRAKLERVEREGERGSLSLARVRELSRRIGALHQREEVLRFALDAAIELTSAERGFVLLRDPAEGFRVASAANMDGARMRKSEWKWSRSIAERVIRQGEPVLTVDAGCDPRFARQASVHAMQLKSVLCAPIRGKDAIVGALYLDNRLARARFAPADTELLLTFADQVAIALAHAELVRALEQKARELANEKRKVEQLARGQAGEIERLSEQLSAQRALGTRYDYHEIIGRSEPMQRVLALLDRVTDSDLSVLVQGESGTGKELVARALHRNGARAHAPFVSINCAALPEALLESELFGHVKGAFTGATSAREGLFVSARGGTLFLDELGEMPLSMQAKLLRVLNDGEVRAVGATQSRAIDVRLICATNRDLKQRVRDGAFREDLFYRVSVVELKLPALRERQEDLLEIAHALLGRRAEQTGQPVCKLSHDAVRALLAHAWPGNVRELSNTLLRASVLATNGLIRAADLALSPVESAPRLPAATRREYVQKEAERLMYALEAERWNVSRVAQKLGIPRNTLYRKLARYGLRRNEE